MRLPNSVGWLVALLGGTLCVLEGALILANPQYYLFDSFSGYLVLMVEGAALLSLSAALVWLRATHSGSLGRVGTAGFLAAFVGTVLAGSGHVFGLPFFEFVNTGSMAYVLIGVGQGVFLGWGTAYVVGVILMSAGYLLLGTGVMRAGTPPRWVGPLLIVDTAALWFGNAVGWILWGLAWILVAYAARPGKSARTAA